MSRYLWGHVLGTYQLPRTGRVGSGQAAPRTARPGPVRSVVSARATRFRVANPSRAFIATCALTMACGMTSGRWITRRRGGVAEILTWHFSPSCASLYYTFSSLQLSSILIIFSSATTTRISSKSSPDSKTLYTSLSCSSSSCFASVLLAHCRRSWIFLSFAWWFKRSYSSVSWVETRKL
jgi:hypothetical protein